MENLNLKEKLENCPVGTELYSPIYGTVYFKEIKETHWREKPDHIICCTSENAVDPPQDCVHIFHIDGKITPESECMLFPSKDQRDWSKFERPIVVDQQSPGRVYWFQATGDAKIDNLLMKSLQKITGITNHCCMLTDSIVFSSYNIIDCASKNNNLARAAMMFGVELRIKE